jgi:hypothetical protein
MTRLTPDQMGLACSLWEQKKWDTLQIADARHRQEDGVVTSIKITGPFKLSKDGKKVEPDHKARIAKLPVNQQIAAREGAKNKVRYVKRGGK